MDEERRCQDPHRLCANNCGFFGNPATNDLCSKCYRDRRLTEEQADKAIIAVEKSLAAPLSSSPDVPPVEGGAASAAAPAAVEQRSEDPRRLCTNDCGFFGSPATDDLCSKCYREIHVTKNDMVIAATSSIMPSAVPDVSTTEPAAEEPKRPAGLSRCACPNCNKKVGVIGFKCKCGEIYCRDHRLPEKHECSFDYKSLGRERIEKANPVVKAEKLDKI